MPSWASLWGRLQGWRPLWPSINEERIGLLCFEPAELKSLGRADATLTAELRGPAGTVLTRLEVPRAQLLRDGLRVHRYQLSPGPHELRLMGASGRWRVHWQAPVLSPMQSRLGQACAAHGTPVLFCGPCDSTHYPYADTSLQPWFDQPDALHKVQQMKQEGRIDDDTAAQLQHFIEHGYVEIEQAFDEALLDQVNAEVDAAAARGHQGYVMGTSQRLEQLHRPEGAMRRLWLEPRARRIVEQLFGSGAARPSQTLAFLYGSQQDAHQDTVHLTPFPAGFMCGMWIALQDVQPGSGELVVYPGSHRTPRLRLADFECPKVRDGDWGEFGRRLVPVWNDWAREREPRVYRPRKGSALIWHENLLHAGSPRERPELTRRSVVIHYYCDDTIAYCDSTGESAMAATHRELGLSSWSAWPPGWLPGGRSGLAL